MLIIVALFVAPPPRVEVFVNSGQFLSDSRVVLLCTITLPVIVNSQVTIATSWFGPNGQLRNSSSVLVSNTYAVTDRVFQSSLTISNFMTSVNNGDYLCNATVVPMSPHVIGTSAVGRRTVTISG